jgi:hypothetical protein
VSHEVAKLYKLEKKKLKGAIGIMEPTGVLIWVAEDYEVLFPLGGPTGGQTEGPGPWSKLAGGVLR